MITSDQFQILIPSRGRPQNIEELGHIWTNTQATGHVKIIVDDDDPELEKYRVIVDTDSLIIQPSCRIGPALNLATQAMLDGTTIFGFMGDDHRPRTPYWTNKILEVVEEMGTGIVYGNDLVHGEGLPTAVFMTSDIVRALGYFCPPGLQHSYLDNAWKAWGEGAGYLRYLPDVTIEHCHPIVGKAHTDATYETAWSLQSADAEAWQEYQSSGQLQADIEKIRSLRG